MMVIMIKNESNSIKVKVSRTCQVNEGIVVQSSLV